tara:strand:+ start:99 stop:389 length:291 start_codon:yes stop_codon:yes gene_type:complete
MTKAEEILEKHLKINDVETMLGRHGATHKAVINALNEAINYTRCCTELKEKKAIPFEDWARVKGIKLLIDSNYRWDKTYVEKEVVMKMYEVYLINL